MKHYWFAIVSVCLATFATAMVAQTELKKTSSGEKIPMRSNDNPLRSVSKIVDGDVTCYLYGPVAISCVKTGESK